MSSFEARVAAVKREIRARSLDGIERRTVTAPVELRDLGDGNWQIAGYGYVYNSWSEDLGGFREMIMPGAGDEVMANNPDIRGLFNHDPNLVLGRTAAGTMKVELDSIGSRYVINPPDTSYARDLRSLLQRGDVNQSSFAFRVGAGGSTWEEDPESDGLLRRITKFSGMYDHSPVTYPAYSATTSGIASVRMDVPSTNLLAQMIALGTNFIQGESSDEDDVSAMESIILNLTDLLGKEATEEASAPTIERNGSGPAGERAEGGDRTEQQADDKPWRLRDAQRRMALRRI